MTNTPTSPSASAESTAAKPARLMSLDALRGFDMFWIVGADALVEALRKVSESRVVQGLARQLEHVGWAGLAVAQKIRQTSGTILTAFNTLTG